MRGLENGHFPEFETNFETCSLGFEGLAHNSRIHIPNFSLKVGLIESRTQYL